MLPYIMFDLKKKNPEIGIEYLGLVNLLSDLWFSKNIFTAPPRPMVGNGAFSHKINYFTIFFGDFKP